jgi:hypothetical protein
LSRNCPGNILGLFPKIKRPPEHDLPLATIPDDHGNRHVAGDDVGVRFFVEGRPLVRVAALLGLLEQPGRYGFRVWPGGGGKELEARFGGDEAQDILVPGAAEEVYDVEKGGLRAAEGEPVGNEEGVGGACTKEGGGSISGKIYTLGGRESKGVSFDERWLSRGVGDSEAGLDSGAWIVVNTSKFRWGFDGCDGLP